MKLIKSIKTVIVGLTCLAAFSPNVFAGVPIEDAKNCGLNYEHCTDTCPTKRCSGNDLNVCKYAYDECLRVHEVPGFKFKG